MSTLASLVAEVDAVRAGRTSATALLEAALARVAAANGDLRALVHVDEEGARAAAAAIDAAIARGEPTGPLAGAPVVVKDALCTKTMPTRCG